MAMVVVEWWKEKAVNVEELRALLAAHREELDSFGVVELLVFGSVARAEAGPESDVDLLVTFSRPTGAFTLVHLRERLEEILGRPVDLVTEGGLRPWMREAVREEAVRAA